VQIRPDVQEKTAPENYDSNDPDFAHHGAHVLRAGAPSS